MTEFPFEEGDMVLVKYRDGPTGRMQVKFVAECADISGRGMGSDVARFGMPFGTMNSVSIRPYEAEFEVVESIEEVDF